MYILLLLLQMEMIVNSALRYSDEKQPDEVSLASVAAICNNKPSFL